MYVSAMSQPGTATTDPDVDQEEEEGFHMELGRDGALREGRELTEANTRPPPVMNQVLSASQTVDAVMTTPEAVPSPDPLLPPPAFYSPRLDGGDMTSVMRVKYVLML